MKKMIILLLAFFTLGIGAKAQTQTKVKKTSTIGQKIHNTFSRHKRHKGYKIKREVNGHKSKKIVDYKEGKTVRKKD